MEMTTPNLGNQLNQVVQAARSALFVQGELAQLSYSAFGLAAEAVKENHEENLEITYPVGYTPDRNAIPLTRNYAKEELLQRYHFLTHTQLGVNAVFQLVTIIEAMLSDVLRATVIRYPQKLGAKRTIPIQSILESATLEEVHLKATDALINELSFKSPNDYAAALDSLISVNLLECVAFHKYIEVKAARDIYIHNRGIANDVYVRKAGSHARVKANNYLPIDNVYFLQSYEYCLQVTEWLEQELHNHWHSSDLEARSQPQLSLPALGDVTV